MPEISYAFDMPTYDALVTLRKPFNVNDNARVIMRSIALSTIAARYCDGDGILTILDRWGLPVKVNLRG